MGQMADQKLLDKNLKQSDNFRLTLENDTKSVYHYRFHNRYRRLLLGLRIFILPILLYIFYTQASKIILHDNLSSILTHPLIEIKNIELIEESLKSEGSTIDKNFFKPPEKNP